MIDAISRPDDNERNYTRRDISERDARLALKLATKYVEYHAGPLSPLPLSKIDREHIVADILSVWYWSDWTLSPQVVDSLRATLYSVLRWAKVCRWKITDYDQAQERHHVTALPSDGVGEASRQLSPARLVGAAESVSRSGCIVAVSERSRKARRRVRCNKGHKLPPKQHYRWLVPGGPIFSYRPDGTRYQLATRLRIDTATRYRFTAEGTVANREQRSVRLRLPEHMPNVGRLDYGPLCYALTGADHDPRERLPTFTRDRQPEPLRPLPRTENETTPVKSPVRWNATHTSAERQLIGLDDLTG